PRHHDAPAARTRIDGSAEQPGPPALAAPRPDAARSRRRSPRGPARRRRGRPLRAPSPQGIYGDDSDRAGRSERYPISGAHRSARLRCIGHVPGAEQATTAETQAAVISAEVALTHGTPGVSPVTGAPGVSPGTHCVGLARGLRVLTHAARVTGLTPGVPYTLYTHDSRRHA